MPKPFDILSLGSCYVDINSHDYTLKGPIEWESVVESTTYDITPGGSAVNFAKILAHFGLKSVFVGKIGADTFGDYLKTQLSNLGVEPALIREPTVQTNLSINLSHENGKTVMLELGSANQSLTAEELLATIERYLPETSCLYLGAYLKLKKLMPAYPELIQRAHATKTTVILSHGKATDKTTPAETQNLREVIALLQESDIYLASDADITSIWDSDLEKSVARIRKSTPSILVLTQGHKDTLAVYQGRSISLPVFPVQARNTVGAGDSFNAGFIRAWLKNPDLVSAVRFAQATAALKISQDTIPSYDGIVKFITTKY